ncbi:hypothetical protein [Bradyrhizobium sp.]|uniref:hypothetical protein n=1 Tax=Bradyrhizobium sp. TaxID=376 RepID=UPI002A28ABA3|nr:hypothetical protein [Bradyrhizobium sp.]
MVLDALGWSEAGSSELTEARRPGNDCAHVLRSDFVATEPEKFTRGLKLVYSRVSSQWPDLVTPILAAKQPKRDADGFFCDSTAGAGPCGRPLNQFVHTCPAPVRFAGPHTYQI